MTTANYVKAVHNRGMRTAVAIVLIIAGAIWTLQGFDAPFAPESFMTSNPLWIVLGLGTVGVGLFLLARSRKV